MSVWRLIGNLINFISEAFYLLIRCNLMVMTVCETLPVDIVCMVPPELRLHPLFADINWDNIHSMPAPFVPNPDDDSDTSYFDGQSLLRI